MCLVKTRHPGQRGARQTTELDPGPVASRVEGGGLLETRNALSDCAFTVRARPPLAFTPLPWLPFTPALHGYVRLTPKPPYIRTASPLLLPSLLS